MWFFPVAVSLAIPLADGYSVVSLSCYATANRLRWYGHGLRKDNDDWVKKCMEHEVEGPRPRGRQNKTWKEVVREDCQARKLNKEDAMDRCRWNLTFLLQCSLILLAFKTGSHCSQIFLLRRHLIYFAYGQT